MLATLSRAAASQVQCSAKSPITSDLQWQTHVQMVDAPQATYDGGSRRTAKRKFHTVAPDLWQTPGQHTDACH